MLDQQNSKSAGKQPLWGIVGGMGPLASNEFLNNIYQLSLGRAEQNMPRVILVSDPSVPDRTTAIKAGRIQEVARPLQGLIVRLAQMEVDHIVIACVTAHFFLPYLELASSIRERMISLISVVCESLRHDQRKYLLLRTSGTRDARIFEDHPGWDEVSSQVCVLDDKDQETVHDERAVSAADLRILSQLKEKYQVDGFIAGCTEVHLHTRDLLANGIRMIDPLYVLAQRIAQPICAADFADGREIRPGTIKV